MDVFIPTNSKLPRLGKQMESSLLGVAGIDQYTPGRDLITKQDVPESMQGNNPRGNKHLSNQYHWNLENSKNKNAAFIDDAHYYSAKDEYLKDRNIIFIPDVKAGFYGHK